MNSIITRGKWKKLGLIFKPENNFGWMCTHAQLPIADHIKDDIYRIYFATRNNKGYPQIGFIEIDINKPCDILTISEAPILSTGNMGYFDEHGVYPSCIVNYNGEKYLYYAGWTNGIKPMFYLSIGLAISKDNGVTFEKISPAPIVSRSKHDPWIVTSPYVFIEDNIWKMIYVSGIGWAKTGNNMTSRYHLKYAESQNGINWKREGKSILNFKNTEETNIARAAVIKENNIYKMWFCYMINSTPYKIGYAESTDFINWERNDELSGITLSEDGYDNISQCYPHIFIHKNQKYMLYNGNVNGKEGILMAIME